MWVRNVFGRLGRLFVKEKTARWRLAHPVVVAVEVRFGKSCSSCVAAETANLRWVDWTVGCFVVAVIFVFQSCSIVFQRYVTDKRDATDKKQNDANRQRPAAHAAKELLVPLPSPRPAASDDGERDSEVKNAKVLLYGKVVDETSKTSRQTRRNNKDEKSENIEEMK